MSTNGFVVFVTLNISTFVMLLNDRIACSRVKCGCEHEAVMASSQRNLFISILKLLLL